MKYTTTETSNNVIILNIENEIMLEDVEPLKNSLTELLDKGHQKIVINLEKCEYITSMGLSTIIGAKKRFILAGGDLKVSGINTLIEKLFELTNLTKKLTVFDSVEKAAESF